MGAGNIFNQGQEATAVSALKMDISTTVQLRYIADEDEDNFYIALFTRDGIVPRGSQVRIYWKIDPG